MRLLLNLLILATYLYQAALVVYFLLGLTKPAQSKLTLLLSRIVEPVLVPTRRFLAKVLPAAWQKTDLSPVAAWIVLWLIRDLLEMLRRIF